MEPSSSPEYTTWTLNVMRKDLDQTMEIFAQILREPRFDPARWQLARDLKLEELRRLYDDPQKLAFREFNRYLYRGNARGRLSSRASVQAIAPEDLRAFHRASYFPQNMMVALSGDLSKVEARELIRKHFGDWRDRGKMDVVPQPERQIAPPIYYLVKETPQSVIITGQLAPAKKTRDYFAFSAMDFLIGSGGFRSQIFQEIRTNRGLAYSAGSFYRARTDFGAFGTYAMTKTESVPTVLPLLKSILQQARTVAPASLELTRAKRAIQNSFIFEYQSARQIAAQQMMIEFNTLPADFLSTYCTKIEKLTESDLLRVGADHLRPDDMLIFILGSAAGYEALKKTHHNIEEIRMEHD